MGPTMRAAMSVCVFPKGLAAVGDVSLTYPLSSQKSSDSAQRWVPVNDVGIAEPPPKMGQDYRGPIGDNFKDRPFLERLNFLHIGLLTITPLLGLYGVCTATWDWRTCAFAVFYYVFSGLGITAGAYCAVTRFGDITSLPVPCTWPRRLPSPLCSQVLRGHTAAARASAAHGRGRR